MIGILSTRLEVIHEQLERIKDFNYQEDKRLRDLEDLANELKGAVKSVQRVQDNITAVRRELDAWPELLPNRLCDRCDQVLEDLRNALKDLNDLEDGYLTLSRKADEVVQQRLAVQDSDLYIMAKNSIGNEVGELSKRLNDIRFHVEDLGEPARTDWNAWQQAWEQYYDEVYVPSRDLFNDYVDFLHGVATRDVSLDEDICRIADQCITEWGSQVSLTIPAMAEALECTVARIVRLGFRDWNIWALPLVAREVGFVLNSKDTESKQVADFIEAHVERGEAENDLRIFLADVFASSAMGPAYGFAAIYMQFDPRLAIPKTDHVPSDIQRAEIIFSTLNWLSHEMGNDDPLQGIVDTLRREWKTVLYQAGQSDQLAAGEHERLSTLAEELAVIVRATHKNPLFSREAWNEAIRLRDEFLEPHQQDRYAGGARRGSFSAVTALTNAAWLARCDERFTRPRDAQEIATRAKSMFADVRPKPRLRRRDPLARSSQPAKRTIPEISPRR